MKNLILLLVFTMTSQLSWGFSESDIYLQNTTIVDLGVEESALTIMVPYPGLNFGLCSVEIRGNNIDLTDLYNEIELVELEYSFIPTAVLKKNNRVIEIDLSPEFGTYVTGFSVATKSGNSLQEVIQDTLGHWTDVILLGKMCDEN